MRDPTRRKADLLDALIDRCVIYSFALALRARAWVSHGLHVVLLRLRGRCVFSATYAAGERCSWLSLAAKKPWAIPGVSTRLMRHYEPRKEPGY